MADIHHLPLVGLSGNGLRRSTQELARSFEAGDDLGSRVFHIRASAHALDELSDRLKAKIADMTNLIGPESKLGLPMTAAIAALKRIANQCRTFSRIATALPRTDPLDATRSPKPRV
ncbi:hypothetical protein MKK88_31140 [Methylobacterium sp. E-005]|uniref:hypothetical protein n=1 Tax=Methylobacterium sp. E-005 TaxID=2836549 RepID=UPI001FB9A838|nr:hypothetical protein [Methylobacterium sp. E-005]MCJ2090403.1 hypothetical protein [Methylobacterium sp. E-005]